MYFVTLSESELLEVDGGILPALPLWAWALIGTGSFAGGFGLTYGLAKWLG